jgi:GT2 family glycosyltransferase
VPIGVLIKTWNTGECTRLCLDTLVRADDLPDELVVVDLGDDTMTRRHAEALADEHAIELRWLPIGQRLAPGEGNRLAFEASSAPYLCLLDSDVLVPRNWLAVAMPLLADPNVGLVAPIRPDPFVRYPGREESTEAILDEIKRGGGSFAEIAHAFTGGAPLDEFGRAARQANGFEHTVTIDFPSFFSSCCLFFDRAVVEEAGGVAHPAFDRSYGSEDIDLSWRVLAMGYSLARTADIFILHFRHTSLEANQVDYQSEIVAANRVLYARWKKRLIAWAVARSRAGDSLDDLSRRFIIRELMRNTSFAEDLQTALA